MRQRSIVVLAVSAALLLALGGRALSKKSGAGAGAPTPAHSEADRHGAAATETGPPVTMLADGAATPTTMPAPPEPGTPPPGAGIPTGPDLTPKEWEERIGNLLVDESMDHRQAASKLLEIASWANVSEGVRTDALLHGLNLLDDEGYLEEVLPLAPRADLPREMQEILFADLHNRPQEVSVPAAKAIASEAEHPLAEAAKDFVDLFEGL